MRRNRGDRRGLNPRQLEPQGSTHTEKPNDYVWERSRDVPSKHPNCPHCDTHSAPGADIDPLEGATRDRFWLVARRAGVSIGTVFAVAGGHTSRTGHCGNHLPLPVAKVRAAARAVAGGAA